MQISWDDIAPALVGAETPVFAALNVDERTREQIILKIKSLFPDRFFLYISHNVIEVARFCRQVLVLRGAHRHPRAVDGAGPGRRRRGGRLPGPGKTMPAIMNAI
jgi:hypothetical protein